MIASTNIPGTWLAALALAGLLLGLGRRAWRWRHRHAPLRALVHAMRDACDEGERAYRQQLRAQSPHPGAPRSVSIRGLALARLLPALFPAAAFLLLRGTRMLAPDVVAAAAREDFDPVRLATRLALRPLDLAPSHPDHAEFREDADMATRVVLGLLLGEAGQPPLEPLGRANQKLGGLWRYALSLSYAPDTHMADGPPIGDPDDVLRFCTSGLSRFADWITALRH